MADPKGFLKLKREDTACRPVCERVQDYQHVARLRSNEQSQEQASRCMDCGTPFCHWGCPVGNLIPEWNDLVFRGQWEKAFELLDATNNLPEVTGRICPSLCEYACVLGINDDPVTIRENELSIIEYAFNNKLIQPRIPRSRTGKKTAVIGSGPAGLSCADQLNSAGHSVVVFEKDDKIGGILRYGIPDFKLEKWVIDRRIELLKQEGITFQAGINVGAGYDAGKLRREFDAICLAGGSRTPRDLPIEGRHLKGIYFAMDYLTQANRRVKGERIAEERLIEVRGRRVVVVGGGDTGADCVGVAHRQGASCVVQLEVMPCPPECRTKEYPWPRYPLILKTTSSHEEGGERSWSVLTKKFVGEQGALKRLSCVRVAFPAKQGDTCPAMQEVKGSDFAIDADVAIVAVGFVHPEHQGLLQELGVALDVRGNVKTNEQFMTSAKGVFSAGDMRRGQSLIVWAISEGRKAAYHIDRYLMGTSFLPTR